MKPVNNANHKPQLRTNASPSAENTLTQTIAATLERSSTQLDATTATQLMAVRQQALAAAQPQAAPLKSKLQPRFAIAASVLAVAMIPWLLPIDSNTDALNEDDFSYLSVDPDMLGTMEMLSILGDGDYGL